MLVFFFSDLFNFFIIKQQDSCGFQSKEIAKYKSNLNTVASGHPLILFEKFS